MKQLFLGYWIYAQFGLKIYYQYNGSLQAKYRAVPSIFGQNFRPLPTMIIQVTMIGFALGSLQRLLPILRVQRIEENPNECCTHQRMVDFAQGSCFNN